MRTGFETIANTGLLVANTRTRSENTGASDQPVDHFESPPKVVKKLNPRRPERHFEVEISPHGPEHAALLRACLDYQGSRSGGKVHVNLDVMFWNWLADLNPEVIEQYYTNAVFLTGEYVSSAADYDRLAAEAGFNSDLDPEQCLKNQSSQKHARLCLQLLQTQQTQFSFMRTRIPKGVQLDYKKATGGNLTKDYGVHERALNMRQNLKDIARMHFPREREKAVKKLMSRDIQSSQALVFTLKQLEQLREKTA